MPDTRVVCSANCSWWDSIDKVGRTGEKGSKIRIPACPHCGSVLYEFPTLEAFMAGAEGFQRERRAHGYIEFVKWMRGRCFPTWRIALAEYTLATGGTVQNLS